MNKQHNIAASEGGFSLVEVLVALVVLSVGLLGIAKMQALALSSTSVASMRSLAALQAASLAAAMHENRGYWTSAAAIVAGGMTVQGTTVTKGPPAATCTFGGGAPCTPTQLAAYDLQQWANNLSLLLPNDKATVTCLNNAGLIDCTILISWTEKTLGINNAQAAQATAVTKDAAGVNNPTYQLFVEP